MLTIVHYSGDVLHHMEGCLSTLPCRIDVVALLLQLVPGVLYLHLLHCGYSNHVWLRKGEAGELQESVSFVLQERLHSWNLLRGLHSWNLLRGDQNCSFKIEMKRGRTTTPYGTYAALPIPIFLASFISFFWRLILILNLPPFSLERRTLGSRLPSTCSMTQPS